MVDIEAELVGLEKSILYFANSLGGSWMEVDDIAQELRVRIIELVDRYDSSKGATFKTWVLSWLQNRAIDVLRSSKPAGIAKRDGDHPTTERLIWPNGDVRVIAGGDRPELEYETEEAIQMAESCRDLRPFVLLSKGMLQREVAEELGVSPSRVSQLVGAFKGSRAARDRMKHLGITD